MLNKFVGLHLVCTHTHTHTHRNYLTVNKVFKGVAADLKVQSYIFMCFTALLFSPLYPVGGREWKGAGTGGGRAGGGGGWRGASMEQV